MHWSAILVLALAGSRDASQVAVGVTESPFASYTQAWHAAHDAERPMLVILNPAQGQGIDVEQLGADEHLQPLLKEYVVAVIDTGTEHGKKVHEIFGSPALPRVVVIDKEQKTQIYHTSGNVTNEKMANILDAYKSGEAKAVLNIQKLTGSCPNCQRRATF